MTNRIIPCILALLVLAGCGSSAKLYKWERGRKGIPQFADITLCYGGALKKEPVRWDADRFAPQVSFVDAAGVEHWLFEAFLCLDDFDGVSGRGLSINPAPGRKNGTKESWENFLDYWLAPDGALAALDEAVGNAAGRMGNPKGRRLVVMMMPDPVQLEIFADKSSSTTYWGDGLDFSKAEDQIKAYRWYIDACRKKFDALEPKYLELGGFYILSEDLVAKPEGFNYKYKRWDQILPGTSDYLHSLNYGLYWIPWNFAPGYDISHELGIDITWMQPGAYWDEEGKKPWAKTMEAIEKYDLSMEFEFEYSACSATMKKPGMKAPDASWHMTKTFLDVPAFRDRFRDYMAAFKEYGLYGKKPIALYSGTNTMWQLANSSEPDDLAFYRQWCQYVIDSPLRTRQ